MVEKSMIAIVVLRKLTIDLRFEWDRRFFVYFNHLEIKRI